MGKDETLTPRSVSSNKGELRKEHRNESSSSGRKRTKVGEKNDSSSNSKREEKHHKRKEASKAIKAPVDGSRDDTSPSKEKNAEVTRSISKGDATIKENHASASHRKQTSPTNAKAVNEKTDGEGKKSTPKKSQSESGDFALNAFNWILKHNNVDLLMNLKDEYWCETILGTSPGTLNDLAGIFLRSHNVYADEKSHWGPPKWNYSSDVYDSFDYYMQSGCPNCGLRYSTDYPEDLPVKPIPALSCKACGHRACPLHFDTESEAIVDRLTYSLQQQKEAKQADVPGAIYIRGTRRVHDFGQNGKEWWQSYFLPASYRLNVSQASMAGADLLGDSKGEKVKEVCEVCGHDEAFFATFQARSADEGLTIMYECTRCHSRKTFNN